MILMNTNTFREFYGLNDGFGGTNYERAAQLAKKVTTSYSYSNLSRSDKARINNALTYGSVAFGADGVLDITTVAIHADGGPGMLTDYSFQLIEQNGLIEAGFIDGANFSLTHVGAILGIRGHLTSNDNFWRGKNGKYYSTNKLYKDYWGKGGKYVRGVQGLRIQQILHPKLLRN